MRRDRRKKARVAFHDRTIHSTVVLSERGTDGGPLYCT